MNITSVIIGEKGIFINMSLLNIEKKLRNYILREKQAFFTIDTDVQKQIIKSFSEPLDLIDRSYKQYLCQMKQLPLYFRFLQSTASAVYAFYYYLKHSSKNNTINYNNIRKIAVFISETKDISYIPESLKSEFDEIVLCDYKESGQFNSKEKRVIRQIYARYWYKPYFCLKCMMKISLYAKLINQYLPMSVLTFGEFSFSSSVLTYYCNTVNVQHINIMHGEKLFDIKDSFVKFNRYYVWDEHYIDLMVSLRAYEKQFLVEQPSIINLNLENRKEFDYELTYYLQDESEKDLEKIAAVLRNTGIPLIKLCIRYHPIYGNRKQIEKIFRDFVIQHPCEIPLRESLSLTKSTASLYSTVLYQAYINGKTVIIDDVTNIDGYKKLNDLMYIMIQKPHLLLSDIIS